MRVNLPQIEIRRNAEKMPPITRAVRPSFRVRFFLVTLTRWRFKVFSRRIMSRICDLNTGADTYHKTASLVDSLHFYLSTRSCLASIRHTGFLALASMTGQSVCNARVRPFCSVCLRYSFQYETNRNSADI